MNGAGEGRKFRRRSWAEGAQFLGEFERSGLKRKEFSAAHAMAKSTVYLLGKVLSSVV